MSDIVFDKLESSAVGPKESPKLLKLISVSFKEAALDSPTFRASANHYNHLIEQTEQWVDGLLKFIKKFRQYYNEFKEFSNILVDQLNPNFISDGIIDQDYTLSALNFTQSGLSSLWVMSLKTLKIDESELVTVLTAAKNELKTYKDHRKAFELAQSKYDLYLSRYAAQSKTKEPSALREDAFQLSEVRKSYIHLSLEVCLALSNIQNYLDSTLVSVVGILWKDIDKSVIENNPKIAQIYEQLDKIRSWTKACDLSLKILSKDMNTARKQIEESAVQQFTPSRDINDHNPALINPNTLLDLKDPVFEKHGWVFMKTSVGKPARQIWVRRWGFVKNGMFGLLNLSPSKTFVQETDKIGVLLCNVRYAANEDRRFCFEIKTIDTTITLQVETLNELKYWMKAFAVEKKRSLELVDKKTMTSYAFGRYPPLLSEFASTATTTSDFELTSGKIENNNSGESGPNSVITSTSLSTLMNTYNKAMNPDFNDYIPENVNDVQFSKLGIFTEPILNTPITTRLTKAAIMGNAFLTSSVVPNAINANIWGTVNWGMYYLVAPETKAKVDHFDQQSLLVSLNELEHTHKNIYPSFYPKRLINDDIQMRALFETALKKDELCLVSFRCIWSPNLKQELSGRCFITMDNIYFYMNSMGFVSLLMRNLNDMISVECTVKKNWDILKVYSVDGSNVRAKIFLDNAKVIAKQIEILINNKTAKLPLNLEQLVVAMKQAEVDVETSVVLPVPVAVADPTKEKSQDVRQERLSSLVTISDKVPAEEYVTDYTKEYDQMVLQADVNFPAKALFHVLFGDKSTIYKEVITLIADNDGRGYEQLPWKITKTNDKLQRKIVFQLSTKSKNLLLLETSKTLLNNASNGILLGKMSDVQVINQLVDNQYYNVSTERSSLELPLGAPFKLRHLIIIKAIGPDSCGLYIYNRIDFSKISPGNFLVGNLYRTLLKSEAARMYEAVKACSARIGEYGKINKAIKLYGQLGTKIGPDAEVDTDSYTTDSEATIQFGFGLFLRLWFKVIFVRVITVLIWIVRLTVTGVKSFVSSLTMNKFLLFMLLLSGLSNVWLTGKTVTSYWVAKRTEKMIDEYTRMASNNIMSSHGKGGQSHGMMQRAIYSKDIEDLLTQGKGFSNESENSQCFQHFKKVSFVLNYEKSSLNSQFLRDHYGDVSSLLVAQKLQNSLQEIGIRRNELLIDLKILERVEREISIGEWKNWLINENNRCDLVKSEVISRIVSNYTDGADVDVDSVLPGASELLDYCTSCKKELQNSFLL